MGRMPSVAALAQRIAVRKKFSKEKYKDLATRLEVAKRRKQLAELERAERVRLEQLETKAAEAEAENPSLSDYLANQPDCF